MARAKGTGTADNPWVLQTPPGTSEFQMWRDEAAWAPPTNRSPRRRERSRPGGVPPRTRPAAGTAPKKGLRGRFGMYVPPLLEALSPAGLLVFRPGLRHHLQHERKEVVHLHIQHETLEVTGC